MLWHVLFCVLPVALATCPFGYVYQQQTNRCYKFVTSTQAFYMAEEMCQETNAHLVSIYSSVENAWLSQYAQQQGIKGPFYTGLNRLIKTQWSWTDGNSVNYTRWAPGEPNVDAQCAAENATDANWITVSCSAAYPYVCVQPSTDPPATTCAPATAAPTCPTTPRQFLFLLVTVPSHCQSEWTYYAKTDSCYKHFLNAAFDQAEDVCKSIGGHLTSIHSEEENTFVLSLTHMGVEYKNEKQLTWIGLMKSNTNNLWNWVDGSALDYVNWASDKPENLTGIENCAQMYSDSLDKNPAKDADFRRWNNVQCSSSMRAYVCKQPALH
ncbi:lectin C-type domain protein [Oesophagostomum dentatum]|uniref:Lectin C-type domain protein n=1 Tax=Oesophagostomum dentatum TaxID=61180 RepID=A0A0B1TFU2_OESDE|nr:lectin C-type domain protein [Oesophagostomum dentatum]